MVIPIKKSLRHKTLFAISCLFAIAVSISSCSDGDEVYFHYHELKDAKWNQKDTLEFYIDSTLFELNVPYLLSIEVTNNVNYSYKNIWFFIQDNLNADSVLVNREMEFELADEFGKWKGTGFGTLFQLSLPVNDVVVFKERRNYIFLLEHGMRDKSLEGIEKVGLCLTKR